jgi:hypothetical protein
MRKLTLLSVCLILAIPCQAEIITVDDNGPADFNNIQAAIDDANDGDTVIVAKGTYIVAKGTYYENINFNGKNIVLTSTDPNDEAVVAGTVIDGNSSGRVITFSGSENTGCVLTGFTITNGYASGTRRYWGLRHMDYDFQMHYRR